MSVSRTQEVVRQVLDSVPLWAGVLFVLALFFAAIQLLGTATDALSPVLQRVLGRLLVGDLPALGIAWLASYALGNGSVIAALALSLFAADLVTPSQLFLLIAGSRLGAAAIVLLIGLLDYVQKRELMLSDSLKLGLLTFVLTYSIYVPVTVVGYLSIPWFEPLLPRVDLSSVGIRSPTLLESVAVALTERVGALVVFLLAGGLILLSLKLFDRVFEHVDREWLRRSVFVYLDNRWLSAALGVLVTGATTSVAFSLGVLVPLYNRGYLKRSELVPYVLGANIGTLLDTLLVALVLGNPVGLVTVGLFLALATVLTGLALVLYRPYYGAVTVVQNRILRGGPVFVGTLVLLVVLPFVFILIR